MQDHSSRSRPESFFARHPTGLTLTAGLAAAAVAILVLRVTVTVIEYRRVAQVADPEPADGLVLRVLPVLDPLVAGLAAASFVAFLLSPMRPVRPRYRRLGAAGLVAAALAGAGSAILLVPA